MYKSGLNTDELSDYFAEFCFYSYKDSKYEFTEEEFAQYFGMLRTNKNETVTAAEFLHDLSINLTLMRYEGGKYYFIHRSFQEYFCALFFSKQKDIFLARLGDFFEDRQKRMAGEQTFKMLYDMIPDRVESDIFIPFLQELFDKCDADDGYWTFLQRIYPRICYEKGEVDDYSDNSPNSFLFSFIMDLLDPKFKYNCDDLPDEKALLVDRFVHVYEEDGVRALIRFSDLRKYPWMEEQPEVVGWKYRADVKKLCDNRVKYEDVLDGLNGDDFIFKSQYLAARQYFETIKEKQNRADEFFLDLL